VSDIHPERNHGSTRIHWSNHGAQKNSHMQEQLETIIENPGNTRGAEQAFGR